MNGAYTNNLALNVPANAVLNLAGNWFNTGSINATNGTVNLGGTFALTNLGSFKPNGNVVNLTGTLNNTNTTWTLSGTNNSWVLNGGTIQGGTVTTSGGASLIVNGSGCWTG